MVVARCHGATEQGSAILWVQIQENERKFWNWMTVMAANNVNVLNVVKLFTSK